MVEGHYQNYLSGLQSGCLVIEGVSKDKVEKTKSLFYHSGLDLLGVEPMQESNGRIYYRMKALGHDPYKLDRTGKIIVDKEYGKEFKIVNPRRDEIIGQNILSFD